MGSFRLCSAVVAIVLVAAACSPKAEEPAISPEAVRALDAFLGSRVGTLASASLPPADSICVPETIADRNVVLDAYRVLEGSQVGDTVTIPVIADLVAVQAEWGPEDHMTKVSVGRTQETLHWRVIRYPDKKFRVCPYANEWVELGLSSAGSVVWAPAGANVDSVRALLTPR
jgi:hypothetical protein